MYNVIFHYFIDIQAGVVRVERLLLHKGVVNNVLPTAIAYHSVPQSGYRLFKFSIDVYRILENSTEHKKIWYRKL